MLCDSLFFLCEANPLCSKKEATPDWTLLCNAASNITFSDVMPLGFASFFEQKTKTFFVPSFFEQKTKTFFVWETFHPFFFSQTSLTGHCKAMLLLVPDLSKKGLANHFQWCNAFGMLAMFAKKKRICKAQGLFFSHKRCIAKKKRICKAQGLFFSHKKERRMCFPFKFPSKGFASGTPFRGERTHGNISSDVKKGSQSICSAQREWQIFYFSFIFQRKIKDL